jgi:hypothetical protein
MCISNGVPEIVCRWSEQTSKGLMWRDIGLDDWLFDLDQEPDLLRIVPTVISMATDPVTARNRALQAKSFVEKRQRESMSILSKQFVGF